MKLKIVIHNGHKNITNGQTGTSGELDLIDKVYYALSPLLIKAGLEVYYDDAKSLNSSNMDYFIAPHFDGATNPSYDGGFVDCNPDSYTKEKDWKFAQVIADYYFNPMGIRFAPEHRTANSTYYYGFNYTGENTVQTIIELGTLTNVHDRAICQDYNKIARLLADGIIAYLKAEDPRYEVPTVPTPPVDYQAQINGLRQDLEKVKKEYSDYQIKTQKELADLNTKCQVIQTKYDTLVKAVKGLPII